MRRQYFFRSQFFPIHSPPCEPDHPTYLLFETHCRFYRRPFHQQPTPLGDVVSTGSPKKAVYSLTGISR